VTASPVRPEVLDAARVMLAQMGISAVDLLQAAGGTRRPVPTFAEYVPIVYSAVPPGSRRMYGTYWNKAVAKWGDRRLDDIAPTDIEALARETQATALRRRNSRGGRSATEHQIAALRCLYKRAVADGIITEAANPAAKVAKPTRLSSTRSALADDRIAELVATASTTGNDPQLDALIVRLHIETACRRGGALALRPQDLDVAQCLIMLREKGGTFRWQPVSPTLMRYLVRHATERRAPGDGQLLRYADGRVIGRRRYDYLFVRLGKVLPWVAAQQVSAHWLRHTTLTWVERVFGYGVALAYAGHAETPNDAGTTARYVKATLEEVATALAALTGEPHPLAIASDEQKDR
jgi:integrase/recombinase XerC